MAEAILRTKIKEKKIKWWDVASCGIQAEVNGTISPNSKAALEEIGIKTDKFSPKQLTQKIIEKSYIVICMTSVQKQMLESCGNVTCIKELCGYDIPDPYGGNLELYRHTRKTLESACDQIIEKVILSDKNN